MKITNFGSGVFTIRDFLSPSECADYIALSERIGYGEAEIITQDGSQIFKEVRNNDRILLDDVELSSSLFDKAQADLPQIIDDWHVHSFNERMRFYRYEHQQYFKWHKDGTFRRSFNEESLLTFMIYLNDQYTGGYTDFRWDVVKPEAGMALVFPHRLSHQGCEVSSGVKYVLRTDVMYRYGGP